MLPPILEIYVVWHPNDGPASEIAEILMAHFRGTAYSGLLGGAVDVYVRSASPTGGPEDSPVPVPAFQPPPYDLLIPSYTALVVVAGPELATAVESPGPWKAYIEELENGHRTNADTVGLFPVCIDPLALDATILADLIGGHQQVAAGLWGSDEFEGSLCRDLGQGIAQMVDPDHERLTVFVSHTKRRTISEHEDATRLIDLVRSAIASTRLNEFFDASDLQPGEDWAPTLVEAASRAALLAVRTDLYSSRPWCQREVATAKVHGMPVVVLDGLTVGEERGSFLMDHVPRVAGRRTPSSGWSDQAVLSALNHLVDECLKRALWREQAETAKGALSIDIDWWAPHAPEPTTFAEWLTTIDRTAKEDEPIIVLHPDPPLGEDECEVLVQIGHLAGLNGPFQFLTPRGLAVHGG